MIRAVLDPASPRAKGWLKSFGSLSVPILEPHPHRGRKPDGTLADFYRLDIGSMTDAQRDRLAHDLAGEFGLMLDEVLEDMRGEHGIPLLAEDVAVAIDDRPLT